MKLSVELKYDAECNDHWDVFGDFRKVFVRRFWSERKLPRFAAEQKVSFDLDEPALCYLEEMRHALNAALPAGAGPCFEVLRVFPCEKTKATDYEHFSVGGLGRDSEGGKGFAGIGGCATCPECGNESDDPSYSFPFDRKAVSREASLLHLFARPYIFSSLCWDTFRRAYVKSGLTGLVFDPATGMEPQDDSKKLYRVIVAQHRWTERQGVCPTCEMKTNARGDAFFNLRETYRYDFQFVRHGSCTEVRKIGETQIVASRQAVAFLQDLKLLNWKKSACVPVAPGFRRDIIVPEARIFRGDTDYPTRVLRPLTPEEIQERRQELSKGQATISEAARRALAQRVPEITPDVLSRIIRLHKHDFLPATEEDMEMARKARWPAKVLDFYAAYEPHYTGEELASEVRLLAIREILCQCETSETEHSLRRLGYLPLASTVNGDAYVYDLRRIGEDGYPKIMLANHEMADGFVTRSEAKEGMREVANGLPEFLRRLSAGQLHADA